MTKEALKYLQAGAIVPVDMETTILLVNALKEALAQPEQEPVAWWDEERDVLYRHCTHDTDDYHKFKRTVPLYAHPPQRPWVELTENEIEVIDEMALTKQWAIRMAMAHLREKNT